VAAKVIQQKLFSVDPSLTCSGWALFSIQTGDVLGVGKVKSLPSTVSLAKRLVDIQERIVQILEQVDLKEGDFLVCEAATTMRDPRSALILEQIRGMFETLARSREVCVPGRVHPRSVQHEILGLKGAQVSRVKVKDIATHGVSRLYAAELQKIGFDVEPTNLKKNQDIVDALLVGRLALTRINVAEQTGVGVDTLFEESQRQRRSGMRQIMKIKTEMQCS
jgi:Holliday junction resolvasome RuvABC endonuclease subunit